MTTTESGNQRPNEDPKGSETPSGGTAKSLDSLLEEWSGSSPADPNTRDVVRALQNEVKPVVDFARMQQQKTQVEEQEKDLNSALDFMCEPEDYKDFPKRMMRYYLEGYSTENDSFADAFQNRRESPEAWRSELSKARDAFPEWLKEMPGSNVRSDVEAAKAAVSGTSPERTEEPEKSEQEQASELFDLSTADFRRHVQKEIAKAGAKARQA